MERRAALHQVKKPRFNPVDIGAGGHLDDIIIDGTLWDANWKKIGSQSDCVSCSSPARTQRAVWANRYGFKAVYQVLKIRS